MPFLEKIDQERIKKTIEDAEALTSGEIRVCIEKHCPEDNPLDRAAHFFYQLEMNKTVQSNGVLIYLCPKQHKMAIIGDKGIHSSVNPDFWDQTKNVMVEHFQKEEWVEGLIAGIKESGQALKRIFPISSNDKNELSDDIYFVG